MWPGLARHLPGLSRQSLESLLSMLLLSNPGEELLGSLQGRSTPLLAPHDNRTFKTHDRC